MDNTIPFNLMIFRKILALGALLLTITTISAAQQPRYQGLLWEITGNGLKKPSYLFGTMHVSSKLAFHLSDSFYQCIRNSDMVALETNPEQLQEDFSKSRMFFLGSMASRRAPQRKTLPDQAFTVSSYADALEAGLAYRPEMINHLLYRTYAMQEDFEENTFLDMYIYQVGSKLGKKATGVENFDESEKLMFEAYRDASLDRQNKRERPVRYRSGSGEMLNDAYRRGDLDMLDSLSNRQSESPAFLEKFLYKRNENMARAIDSIARKTSLFAGVGAAHLPGDRGVINMLRKMGYKLRPVQFANRDSKQKDELDKMRAPVQFREYFADDRSFYVELPGTLFNFNRLGAVNQLQYADLANGAYYLVSRIRTNAATLGQTTDDVMKKIDSSLYEFVPGKITSIKKNTNTPAPGFDIESRTRRGDLQRYRIFVTPFEILIFKISGNGDYAAGPEGDRFLRSIRLQSSMDSVVQPFTYSSAYGGFSANVTDLPFHTNTMSGPGSVQRQEFGMLDRQTGNNYQVFRIPLHGYTRLEEDTVELSFAEETYRATASIRQTAGRKVIRWEGRDCLEMLYKNADSSNTIARFFVQGPHTVLVAARFRQNRKAAEDFLAAFKPILSKYGPPMTKRDTMLQFTVQSPVKAMQDDMAEAVEESLAWSRHSGEDSRTKTRWFVADSTGEAVRVMVRKYNPYFSIDSSEYWQRIADDLGGDDHLVIASRERRSSPETESMLLRMRDTNSSRAILHKVIVRNHMRYLLSALIDSTAGPSGFVKNFFDSFQPYGDKSDTGTIFSPRGNLLVRDFYAADSATRASARMSVSSANFRDADAPGLIRLVKGWSMKEKDYLSVKSELLGSLGMLHHKDVLPFLKNAYLAAEDTSALQQAVARALLMQKTTEANSLFKELVLADIPILNEGDRVYDWFFPLYDTLQLSAGLFPELLQLTALSVYKNSIYRTMALAADSNALAPALYADHIGQIAFDARAALQAMVSESQEQEAENDGKRSYEAPDDDITQFATLLLPFRTQNRNAARFFNSLEKLRQPGQQISLITMYLRRGIPVKDSLLEAIAAQDLYRAKLLEELENIGQAARFPERYRKQELLARSALMATPAWDSRLDSVVYVGKQSTTFRLKKGTVYFYKCRIRNVDEWFLAVSGLQPEKESDVWSEMDLLHVNDKPMDPKIPVAEQQDRLMRKARYKARVRAQLEE
ncbi:TraB/GumN family protein [Chitinophaga sp. NPDC101104]|uniref:TraB/GumN family protein n=1 Tax=Chitinophaga sp. NPDC101104 TaxID=3390561 RepID=UPI003D00879C